MKKQFMATLALLALTSVSSVACSSDDMPESEARQGATPSTQGEAQAVTDVLLTEAIPAVYMQPATEQGRVEAFNYYAPYYSGNGQVGTKTAYVYLPYGYDPNEKYDIIYLLHGFYGHAQDYLSSGSYLTGNLPVIFDNLIQRGDTKPFIAVSPSWYRSGRATNWNQSLLDIAEFYREYENDLIPAVESNYSTYAETTDRAGIIASRDHRAFGGFSLGCITTWYIFEHQFDLQKWFLPMSGDNWHVEMYGGQTQPDATAQFLTTVVDASDYKDNFYVWYAVGDQDSRFWQTENQARAMMRLPETFNTRNFSYHQKAGGLHDQNAVREFVYNALPFFFPKEQPTTGVQSLQSSTRSLNNATDTAYLLNGQVAPEGYRGIVVVNGKKILQQ